MSVHLNVVSYLSVRILIQYGYLELLSFLGSLNLRLMFTFVRPEGVGMLTKIGILGPLFIMHIASHVLSHLHEQTQPNVIPFLFKGEGVVPKMIDNTVFLSPLCSATILLIIGQPFFFR